MNHTARKQPLPPDAWRSLPLRLPLLLLFLVPLAASLLLILPLLADRQALLDFLAHPQVPGAVRLTLFTGLASTGLSLLLACLMVQRLPRRYMREAGLFIAVPHLALAIGLAFLIAPAGVIARLIAVVFTHWSVPPPWVSVQDPYGLALIAALVLKETPFLCWALASLLTRDDLRQQFAQQETVARSLGHGDGSIWWRVVLPQLLARTVWPLVAVFTYGLTVVDMALVIGPAQPPTLASLIWTDLNDGEAIHNARGGAGVLALSNMILLLLLVAGLLLRLGRPLVRIFLTGSNSLDFTPTPLHGALRGFWRLFYVGVGLALVFQSVAGHWPFPQLWPQAASLRAWQHIWSEPGPALTSLVLAVAASSLAMGAIVAWFENAPPAMDRMMLAGALASLCLPSLVLALGQYRLFLLLGLTGTSLAMLLAHLLPVAAYVFLMLQGPYRGFDQRWKAISSGLGRKHIHFLSEVKWPMLRSAILSAWAVGFAVSMAQYLPAQLAAAGRFSTLPMEAITLSAGGNRNLTAAYALMLMALPALAFAAATSLGRPRWSSR